MNRPRTRIHLVDVVGAVIIVVITTLAYAGVLKPLARQRNEVHANRVELDTLVTDTKRYESRRIRAQDELTELRRQLEAMPVRLDEVSRLNHHLARIVELAASAGLQIHESRSGQVKHGPRFDSVPIQLSGRGEYPACAKFLSRVASELPDVDVREFAIAGNPAQGQSEATFEFDFQWFAVGSTAAVTE